MKPIIKYQGGKTKELPIITQIAPPKFTRVIEPFAGGAAVALHYGETTVLNDISPLPINLYRVVGSPEYPQLQAKVNEIKGYDHDQLQEIYYQSRDIINNKDGKSAYELALAYIVVRQLCFSGMERYNSSGEFNVPFGHYKKMSCNLEPRHHQFFSKHVELRCGDAIDIIHEAHEGDFLFLDPPYIDRLGYSTGDGSDGLHTRLVAALHDTKAHWLLIHSDCVFYREQLAQYDIQTRGFRYGQIFGKNKNHSKSIVDHLYIKNY